MELDFNSFGVRARLGRTGGVPGNTPNSTGDHGAHEQLARRRPAVS